MIVALDVDYGGPVRAAAVGIHRWTDVADPVANGWTYETNDAATYRPGHFYERELPALLALIDSLPVTPSVLVVDGHAWLQANRPGLGAHLYEALQNGIPVIGVAKGSFHEGSALPVTRGESTRPLYVSACGIDPSAAAAHVQQMHGTYRIPSVLKAVDRLARGREPL